jgi:hypothetical protein
MNSTEISFDARRFVRWSLEHDATWEEIASFFIHTETGEPLTAEEAQGWYEASESDEAFVRIQ